MMEGFALARTVFALHIREALSLAVLPEWSMDPTGTVLAVCLKKKL
jgi:hypothetical protein